MSKIVDFTKRLVKPEPPPAPAPPPPSPAIVHQPAAGKSFEENAASKETQAKLDEAAEDQRRARGRASTILTSGYGVQGEANTARRTLLPA